MARISHKSLLFFVILFPVLFLGIKYLLPLALPFLFGAGLALAAEPAVRFFDRKLPRGLSTAVGVSGTILFLSGLLFLLASAVFRELASLARALPDLKTTAEQGLLSLQDLLLQLADRAPDSIRLILTGTVLDLFQGGTALLTRLTGELGTLLSGILTHIPAGFLRTGTGIIAGFMISARLPRWKQKLPLQIPQRWQTEYLPVLKSLRHSLFGWLKAQLKLSGTTLAIVLAGLLLLRIPYAPVWAAVIALVDAIPILGTGTVLIPWALVRFIRGDSLQALGLLAVYVVAMITRTILEPRFLGKHLGLDPLVTLVCMYTGYQFWGIGGMILSPMLAVIAMQLANNLAPKPRES